MVDVDRIRVLAIGNNQSVSSLPIGNAIGDDMTILVQRHNRCVRHGCALFADDLAREGLGENGDMQEER